MNGVSRKVTAKGRRGKERKGKGSAGKVRTKMIGWRGALKERKKTWGKI